MGLFLNDKKKSHCEKLLYHSAKGRHAQHAEDAHDAPGQMPASSTPPMQASTLFLKPISSREAARVPVHAPVPGRGIPTNSKRAQNKPWPAFA